MHYLHQHEGYVYNFFHILLIDDNNDVWFIMAVMVIRLGGVRMAVRQVVVVNGH